MSSSDLTVTEIPTLSHLLIVVTLSKLLSRESKVLQLMRRVWGNEEMQPRKRPRWFLASLINCLQVSAHSDSRFLITNYKLIFVNEMESWISNELGFAILKNLHNARIFICHFNTNSGRIINVDVDLNHFKKKGSFEHIF